ncbi:MAG: type II toxin-antitoxin system CcdA family antitoxin [Gammaproteobacteria bacterium]|nr:type II toxin-antitoxin system CcdA family antitoxin [Gammaproteobacteria bacterium]MBU1732173.1 type II toxin-antitoxin system CcdA family antitoxin [Gammaproteobacteria bacterium]MBU1893297.1 type II toxin-antitoxin system CcdA family antitoxin [Gammaproteobacteria bacterium]
MTAASTGKSVNLTLNDTLVKEAKALEINMSREFEIHLASLVRQRKSAKWLTENLVALDAYNAHIERDGVFSEKLRSF